MFATEKSGVGKLPKSPVQLRATYVHATLAGCIALPLVVLSLAPHQEPRFLLPMAMPMCLLFGGVVSRNKWLTALWIFFNVTAVTFFGVLHQGGVTSSLHFLYHHTRSPYSLSPLLSTLSLPHGYSHASTATRTPHQFPSDSTSAHRERSPKFSEQTCQVGLDHQLLGENVFQGGLDSQQEAAQGSGSRECASACGGRGVFVDGRFGNLSVEVIFYHTYMPPRSLLALPLKGTSDHLPSRVKVTDIGGGSINRLHAAILAPLPCGVSPRSGTGASNAPPEPSSQPLEEGEAGDNHGDIGKLTSAWSSNTGRSSSASDRSSWVLKLVVTPATTQLAGTVRSKFSNCSIKWPPEASFGQEKGEGVRFHGSEKENKDGLRGEGEEGERGEGASVNCGNAEGESGVGELGETWVGSLERLGESSCRNLKCPLTLSLLESFGGHVSMEEMGEVMQGVGSGDWSELLELFRLNVYGILLPM